MTQLNATSCTTAIRSSDIEASVRFYTGALGFDIENHTDENGTLRYVTLKAGAAAIGLSRDDLAGAGDRQKPDGIRIWITTDQDLTLLAERIRAAGYILDGDPAPLPWGPVAFSLADPDGVHLTIANGTW